MILFSFEEVTEIPTGYGGNSEITASSDLIDVMEKFRFQTLNVTNKPYFRGLSGYMFDAQIYIGFGNDYKVSDVEVRHPFSCLNGNGIAWRHLNLIQPSLREGYADLSEKGVTIKPSHIGFDAPDIGVSFFSDGYKGSLDARWDAVTIHNRS